MKYRITQPFLILGMIISVMLYCLIMLVIWPVFLIGAYVWKFDTFWKMMDFLYSHIPEMPDSIEKGKRKVNER